MIAVAIAGWIVAAILAVAWWRAVDRMHWAMSAFEAMREINARRDYPPP